MPSLQTFTFQVRDEQDALHEVTFVRHSPGHLSAQCTCQAGRTDRCCSHCLRLLSGDRTQLVSDNDVEVGVVEWWVACLDLKHTVTRALEAQDAGATAPGSLSRVLPHWPNLTARDFEVDLRGSPGRELGVA
jgi:hypothetical protein